MDNTLKLVHSKLDIARKQYGDTVVDDVLDKVEQDGEWKTLLYFKELEFDEYLKCLEYLYYPLQLI